jgi:hypothetical protein
VLKCFFYNDELVNVNQLMWIKRIGDGCLEFAFQKEITWYVFCDVDKELFRDLRLFLSLKSPHDSNIYDIEKYLDSMKTKSKKPLEEEFSHFS